MNATASLNKFGKVIKLILWTIAWLTVDYSNGLTVKLVYRGGINVIWNNYVLMKLHPPWMVYYYSIENNNSNYESSANGPLAVAQKDVTGFLQALFWLLNSVFWKINCLRDYMCISSSYISLTNILFRLCLMFLEMHFSDARYWCVVVVRKLYLLISCFSSE